MTDGKRDERRSDCPLNISLEMFGDRWTLLIVRDLMFKDRRSFKDFLESEEGIASNILTDRLKRLESSGIIEKRAHPGDARKFLYRLTAKGLALAPMLIEMISWAARHEKTAAPPEAIERMTKHRDEFLAELRERWRADESERGGARPGRHGPRAERS